MEFRVHNEQVRIPASTVTSERGEARDCVSVRGSSGAAIGILAQTFRSTRLATPESGLRYLAWRQETPMMCPIRRLWWGAALAVVSAAGLVALVGAAVAALMGDDDQPAMASFPNPASPVIP